MKNKKAKSYQLSGLLLWLLLASPAWAQPKLGSMQAYVKQHAQPIASIDPAFRDDADLAAIGQAIGEARVVLLGEQDHGNGATFQAKTRLVKYLHEQKGFNVLAFEGDFFALNHGWETLPKTPVAMQQFVRDNVYDYWSQCHECEDLLYAYLPQTYQTTHPLRLAGIDNQLYGSFSPAAASRRELPAFLTSWLTGQGVAYAATPAYRAFFVPFLDTLSQPQYFATRPPTHLIAHKAAKLRRFEAVVDTLLGALPPAARASYEGRVLENLRVLTQESAVYTEDEVATYNLRDAQMARNLDWLANVRYPTEKILVWAASSHVSKGPATAYRTQPRPITYMGTRFMANPLNARQSYVLGFSSQRGATRRVQAAQPTRLSPAPRGSFESWINESYAYAFVDFRPWQAAPASNRFFWMTGPHHVGELADWPQLYDGIFFIREMTPCGPSSLGSLGK